MLGRGERNCCESTLDYSETESTLRPTPIQERFRDSGRNVEKSIYTDEYSILLELLAALRQKSGVTQVELAQMLGQSQSFISKVERGDRRLDIIQLRTICQTLGTTLPEFITAWEKRLRAGKK